MDCRTSRVIVLLRSSRDTRCFRSSVPIPRLAHPGSTPKRINCIWSSVCQDNMNPTAPLTPCLHSSASQTQTLAKLWPNWAARSSSFQALAPKQVLSMFTIASRSSTTPRRRDRQLTWVMEDPGDRRLARDAPRGLDAALPFAIGLMISVTCLCKLPPSPLDSVGEEKVVVRQVRGKFPFFLARIFAPEWREKTRESRCGGVGVGRAQSTQHERAAAWRRRYRAPSRRRACP